MSSRERFFDFVEIKGMSSTLNFETLCGRNDKITNTTNLGLESNLKQKASSGY